MTPTRHLFGKRSGSVVSAVSRVRRGSLGDGGDVELELDLVRHQEAAGLQRGVPGQAPLLAGDGGVTLEADPDVAERVAGGAGGLELDADRLGDAADGQVAGHGPVVAVT